MHAMTLSAILSCRSAAEWSDACTISAQATAMQHIVCGRTTSRGAEPTCCRPTSNSWTTTSERRAQVYWTIGLPAAAAGGVLAMAFRAPLPRLCIIARLNTLAWYNLCLFSTVA